MVVGSTHEFSFGDIERAFRMMASKEDGIIKSLIHFDGAVGRRFPVPVPVPVPVPAPVPAPVPVPVAVDSPVRRGRFPSGAMP
ncbi:hypothetical protein [Streptomyces tubercidicus]|uniref:hypothetical protein n=1 Tax=Streptomyces tubercidicus TaxID=47759 RepID=UPI00346595EA